MLDMTDSMIFLQEGEAQLLKDEPEYVWTRYQAIAKTLSEEIGLPRRDAAVLAVVSERQFYRLLKRYKAENITGLRKKSTRPHKSPKISPEWKERAVLGVREDTGFSVRDISFVLNPLFEKEGVDVSISPSTIYKILVRRGVIERETLEEKIWKSFDWKKPNHLLQIDITIFNGVPLLTALCDGTRKAWAQVLPDMTDDSIIAALKVMLPFHYKNMLTDNGKQFCRANKLIAEYCREIAKCRHIWASVHHPQTLGKLGRYQNGLKVFLSKQLYNTANRERIAYFIRIYNKFYNNGRVNSTTKKIPEEMYSGKVEPDWLNVIVRAFNLKRHIPISVRDDICV